MSSLVLVEGVEPAGAGSDAADPLVFSGKRVVPHLSPAVDAGSKPLIYFVVYPDSAGAKPAIRVQFFNAGSLIADKTQDLPAPDSSGAIPMFIGVATRPGASEVKVTVTQGANSAAGSLQYQVR
jgi:hypothetical protein